MADTNSGIKWFWQYGTSSNYGMRKHPISGQNKMHTGIDKAMSLNDKIYSHIEGTVTNSSYSGGYGNLVIVKDANGYSHYFAHMNKTAVSVGDTVNKGTLLGYVGSTGNSTGPHLHYEVRNTSNNSVDPTPFMNIDGTYQISESASSSSNIFSSGFWKNGLLSLMKYIVIVLLIVLFVILITLSMDEI